MHLVAKSSRLERDGRWAGAQNWRKESYKAAILLSGDDDRAAEGTRTERRSGEEHRTVRRVRGM
jgi:hypothetical protein